MKYQILIGASLIAAVGLLLAQGPNPPGGNSWRRYQKPYDSKESPPVSLSEAYALVLGHIGTATNRFYCVSATCLDPTKRGLPGWTFCFSNTNGQRAYMEVSFDKEINTDEQSASVMK